MASVTGIEPDAGRAAAQGVRPSIVAMVHASHPVPAFGVTAFAVALAALAGNRVTTTVVLGAAVLCGQLSIGWSNDRIDAARDRMVGRRDKPLATGLLGPRTLDVAIAVVLLPTIALSLLLGPRAGGLHLAAVSCGWAYNLGLKGTSWSWLPYALAFGALPSVATLSVPGGEAAAAWLTAAAACLGVVGHLTNALPDLPDDARTGVRSAPLRLGARRSVVVSVVLLPAATVLVTFGPRRGPGVVGLGGLAVAATLCLAGVGLALHNPRSRATFAGIFLLVGLELALVAVLTRHLR